MPSPSACRVIAPHDSFAQAFGPDWQSNLSPALTARMLPRRWSPFRYPDRPVRVKRDEVIWTFPADERQMLADLWQPPEDVAPSGLAFLFFHGSAWHFGDKGSGTDPMFRHLASQGHLVLDDPTMPGEGWRPFRVLPPGPGAWSWPRWSSEQPVCGPDLVGAKGAPSEAHGLVGTILTRIHKVRVKKVPISSNSACF